MRRIIILSMLVGLFASCSNASAGRQDTSSGAAVQSDSISAMTAQPADTMPITFAFVGDIMMGTTYPESPKGAYLPANDGRDLFANAAEILRAADVACGNLEGTLLDSGGRVKKCGNPNLCYAFRMPTRYVSNLTDAGFDFVGIANNHINDFGPEGLASTKKTLTDAGIAFAGLRNGCPTTIIERNGKKIGFAAFGHSLGTASIMNLEEVRRNVKDLREKCDIVVVSFHGGGEGKKFTHVPHAMENCFGENRGNVEQFAHTAIDAGADVVYGHGPHVARAMELYKDHLILYSLGNFCTPFRMSLSGVSGHAPLVTATLNPDGTFREGQIHGFIQGEGAGPQPDKNGAVAAQIRQLTLSDFPKTALKISADGRLSREAQ